MRLSFSPIALLVAVLALGACRADETLYSYGAGGQVWHLVSMDGAAVAMTATLEFPKPGQVAGQAPCNRYNATQTAPYPWFDIGPIAATRMACPDLSEEHQFLQALQAMTLSEVLDTTLVLSDETGREMVFSTRP
jgi:heat shock protein HslJ